MAVSLHTLTSPKQAHKKRRGRGNSSGRGTYAGRGQKGQRSRSGGKKGLQRRGLRQVLQKLPKNRGFSSPHAAMQPVNVGTLGKVFDDGATVNRNKLIEHGLINRIGGPVKVLGQGELKKKLTVQAAGFSQSAKQAILKAGGSVQETAPHAAGADSKKKTNQA